MSTRSLGNAAENEACSMLEEKGLVCLRRQFRIREGEVDLVMYDPRSAAVVFVEVRSGNSVSFPAYKESIKEEKIQKMAKVARVFLDNYSGEYDNVRFDAVFIERSREAQSVHLENVAFLT